MVRDFGVYRQCPGRLGNRVSAQDYGYMDVYARSTGDKTEIYTVENRTSAIVVLGAAVGLVAAMIVVSLSWFIGIDVNAGLVGGAAGAIGGAATAILAMPQRLQ